MMNVALRLFQIFLLEVYIENHVLCNNTTNTTASPCVGRRVYNNITGTCNCTYGLEGSSCDRNSSLCTANTCQGEVVCSTFINSPDRCVPNEFQFYLLQPAALRSTSSRYKEKLEEKIKSTYIMSVVNKTMAGTLRLQGKAEMEENVTVEVVNVRDISTHTYVSLLAFKLSRYIKRSEICNALLHSEVKCLDSTDCGVLEKEGIQCPVKFPDPQQPSESVPILTGGIIALIAAAGVIIIILVSGAIFLKVTKGKFRRDESGRTRSTQMNSQSPPPLSPMFEATKDMSAYKHQFGNDSFADDNVYTGEDSGGYTLENIVENQEDKF